MYVYVLRYSIDSTDMVSCYSSMNGVIQRLKMMELHDSFCEDEIITITKEEVIDDEEAELRFNRIKAYRDKHVN